MIPKVTSVKPLEGYRIAVEFSDNASGVINIGKTLQFKGVFARLQDIEFFNLVRVGRSYKTVTWPGQLDLDPVMLYHRATGKSIEWILEEEDPVKPKGRVRKVSATRRAREVV